MRIAPAAVVGIAQISLRGRQLLNQVVAKRDPRFNFMAESNSFEMLSELVHRCDMISFQIQIGAPIEDFGSELFCRPIDERYIPPSDFVLCQLRGRILPIAAASFADKFVKGMS